MNEFASPEERAHMDDLIANSRAESTRKADRRYWRKFSGWLENRGVSSQLPVDPALVAVFAIYCSKTYSFSGLESVINGIASKHKDGGFPSPTRDALVKEVMAGLRRQMRDRPLQAKPLYAADVEKIVKTACDPRASKRHGDSENGYEKSDVAELRGLKDIAIVLVGRDGCLRVSEMTNLLWDDISYAEDGSGIALIRFAKGDQEGAGATQWLSPQTVQALEAIRPETACMTDPVFGLKDKGSINDRIRNAALAAGLGRGYSGHSLRIGMIYDMVDANIPPTEIILAARWKSPDMLTYYTRFIDATKGAVAQLYVGRPLEIKLITRWRPPVVVRYLGDGIEPHPQNFKPI